MSTRSLTIIMDGDTEIAVLYRHHDGYPSGHGAELARMFERARTVNGVPGHPFVHYVNGPGDMAVQAIAALKTRPDQGWPSPPMQSGAFYLHPAGTRDVGEAYTYTLRWNGASTPITLAVQSDGFCWEGPCEAFAECLERYDDYREAQT